MPIEQIAAALLVWIAANSPYAVADATPPPVVLLPSAAMTAMVLPASEAAALPAQAAPPVHGLYAPDEGPRGTIYLVRPEDTPRAAQHAEPSENPLFRERLLHELVHYAQHLTGEAAQFRCPSQGEWRAVMLGGRWLREHKVPDPVQNRRFAAFVGTGC